MNRRDFSRNLALAALGSGALGAGAASAAPLASGGPQPQAAGAPFKISLMLWTVFHRMPFERRLEKAAEAGYRNIELVGEFEKWSDTDYQNANRKRRELGIQFDATGGLSRSLTDPAQRDAFLAEVKGILPAMDKLECPALIILTGNKVPGMSHEAQHASCVEGLKRAADIVEPKGCKILLENIDPEENPKYFLTSVGEGFDVIREVNHPHVRFLYDFFHDQISEGNLIEKLEKNVALVDLVHIADVPGRHEPGTGEINYTNIYKKLAELHYDRYAAMEFLPTGDEVTSLRTAREAAEAAART
ncbi:MAG TPA: TIM barrel protein [Terriglobia bacterium]|nr:TIM barrel protein [Terriglobia bacterium]